MNKIQASTEIIEHVIAEYYNDTYIMVPEYSFYRVSSGGVRYYLQVFPDETTNVCAGITSILNREMPTPRPLIQWYAKNGEEHCQWHLENSGNYGTWFHILAARLLKQEQITFDLEWIFADIQEMCIKKAIDYKELHRWIHYTQRDPRKDIFGFLSWCAEYDPEPIALEYPLANPEDGYACTIDCVAYITPPNGEKHLAIIDWKTGKEIYESHELQLHAQERAWNLAYPDKKIAKIYNWATHDFRMPIKKSVTPYKFVEQTDSENLWKLDHYLTLFRGSSPKVKSYVDFKSTVAGIGTDLNVFEEIDPIKMVLEQ